MTTQRAAWLLLAGDWLCLAAFVLIGMRTHDTLAGPTGLARLAVNWAPLALAWAAAGWALGAFRFQAPARLPQVWGRTLLAWLVAAPLGLLARALLLRAATLVVIFVLITLALGGVTLLAWRTLFALLALRPPRKVA